MRRPFNLIHLETMLKVDVFVSKGRAFDEEALRRARPQALEDAPDVSHDYLRRWGEQLGVRDLLDRALEEAEAGQARE